MTEVFYFFFSLRKKIIITVSSAFFLFLLLTGFWQSEKTGISFTEYSEQIPGSEVTIDMVPVEGGIFIMGSPESEQGREDDEGPRHPVQVNSFWMGKYEITWEQYELFTNEVIGELREELAGASRDIDIDADALSTPTPPYVDMTFGMGREGHPAISITHYAAVMFTKWLTAKTGRFYRLPTEAEWEYACRASSDDAYHFGNNPAQLDNYAWYRDNSNRRYQRVGTKEPNSLGIHDMLGNVAEWTMDQYHDDYFKRLEGDPAVNPWFKPEVLYPRSVRGGSWQDDADKQRCAQRRGSEERWKMLDPQMPKSLWWHTSAQFLGFRIVRPAEIPSREEMQEYWIEAMEDF